MSSFEKKKKKRNVEKEKEKKSTAQYTEDIRSTRCGTVRCPGADFFRQCRAINRANARACVRHTRWAPRVALLKVEPETEFTFAASRRFARSSVLFLSTASCRVSFSNLEWWRPLPADSQAVHCCLFRVLKELGEEFGEDRDEKRPVVAADLS